MDIILVFGGMRKKKKEEWQFPTWGILSEFISVEATIRPEVKNNIDGKGDIQEYTHGYLLEHPPKSLPMFLKIWGNIMTINYNRTRLVSRHTIWLCIVINIANPLLQSVSTRFINEVRRRAHGTRWQKKRRVF